MSVLKPRNRLVYFRVSEDEFQQFHQVCASIGARSISDLARCAIQRMIHDGDHLNADPIAAKLSNLQSIVSNLDRKVERLTERLGEEEPKQSAAAEKKA